MEGSVHEHPHPAMSRSLRCYIAVSFLLGLLVLTSYFTGTQQRRIASTQVSELALKTLSPEVAGRMAWVTMVTDDAYVLGTVVTVQSIIASNSVVKTIVCIVTSKVSSVAREALRTVGCKPQTVRSITSPNTHGSARYADTYTKLNVWSLVEYQTVVFVDADVAVLRNMDTLFSTSLSDDHHVAAADDCCDYFNPGLLVLRPSEHIYRDMLAEIPRLPSYDGGDGGFLNSYFAKSDVTRLPFKYNADQIVMALPRNRNAFTLNEIYMVHFTGPKPWDSLRRPQNENDLNTARKKEAGGLDPTLFTPIHRLWKDQFDGLKLRLPKFANDYSTLLGIY
eukprot:NODE_1084_length_1073_cov_170.395508_g753_i0.p1 GENE.NODE_1084_length_1073_cov_170.395508_g753_i0~~NODE_1084_length_1073_cov_170.395508_g753_i0.p1  ORF type:complete len:336 (+),score=43.20 NODE_1084_length_1073_cov_170.395508_g753_i0:51-1058(+)